MKIEVQVRPYFRNFVQMVKVMHVVMSCTYSPGAQLRLNLRNIISTAVPLQGGVL